VSITKRTSLPAEGAVVEMSIEGVVATLTFSNPEQKGALTPEMLISLREQLANAFLLDCRVVVLRGAGETFSSGYAIDHIPRPEELAIKDEIEETCEAFEASPIVVIAMLRGYAIGAALDLACSCDFRFAERSCVLGMPPAKLGLIYGWRGTRRIERLVGRDAVRYLLFTGDLMNAADAEEKGLVTRAYEDAATLQLETYKFAERLASRAPLSLAGAKRVFRELDRAQDLPVRVEAELHELRRKALASDDAAEALAAFGERRKPNFTRERSEDA
jgi:enoyl-CoA hydratase/carnithine racemase